MKEFFKPVVAQVGGKMVRASQSQLFAQQMVKNGITKGKPRPPPRASPDKVSFRRHAREDQGRRG